MPIISISVPKSLLQAIDEYVRLQGYTGRSELIRDAVREFVASRAPGDVFKEKMSWVIVALTDHRTSATVDEKFISVIHSYQPVVKSFYHQMLRNGWCLNIAVLEAFWAEVESMIKLLRKTRGVIKVWYVPIEIERGVEEAGESK